MKKNKWIVIFIIGIFLSALFTSCTIFGDLEDLKKEAIELNSGETSYTVTFDVNGGSGNPPAPMSAKAGSTITLPSGGSLTRNEFAFDGWYTIDKDGEKTYYSVGYEYTVTGNITMFARWSATYTVTFDGNGQTSASTSVPAAKEVNPGDSIELPSGSGLTRTGFNFDGWNTKSDGSGDNFDDGPGYIPNSSTTLYARWRTTVNFNGNGNTSPSNTIPALIPAYANGSIKLPGQGDLQRTGYAFEGWNIPADGSGGKLIAGDIYYTPAQGGTITFYARWTQTCTVKFFGNGNNGGTVPTEQTVPVGTIINSLPYSNVLTKSGYTSKNFWTTQSDGSGTIYEGGKPLTVNSNIDLYARWDSKVTFNGNGNTGGTVPGVQTVAPNIPVSLPTLTKTTPNLTFDGWNNNDKGTGNITYTGSSFIPNGNIDLYAKWVAEVKFDLNGGQGSIPPAQRANPFSTPKGTITLPTATNYGIKRSGYKFDGWSTSTGSTYKEGASYELANDITLYAKWLKAKVYVAGYYYDNNSKSIACYWIDGQGPYNLSGNNNRAEAITVVNGNIYVAGYVSDESYNTTACYWENGDRKSLPSYSGSSVAKDIAFLDGDVYTVGYDATYALRWKNTVQRTILCNGEAHGIAISGGDMYICGNTDGEDVIPQVFYWQQSTGNTTIIMEDYESPIYANDIAIENGNIHIAGYCHPYSGSNDPYYWNKTGGMVELEDLPSPKQSDDEAYGISVSNGKVYIAGNSIVRGISSGTPRESYAILWVDGTLKQLNGDYAYDITVSGEDIYIAGTYSFDEVTRACYWENEKRIILNCGSDYAFTTSITVVYE